MSVLELLSKRLMDPQLPPQDSLAQLSIFLVSTPCIPAVNIRQSTTTTGVPAVGPAEVKRSSTLCDWSLGFACLRSNLLLVDSAGDAVFPLCNGKPDSLKVDSSTSKGTATLSLVAAGQWEQAALPCSSAASLHTRVGDDTLMAVLALPSSENVLRLLQLLGIQLLSQRLKRTVREEVQFVLSAASDDEHAAVCQGIRTVFPLVQRYLLKVRPWLI
jgi:hypothetical protein